MFRLNKSSSGVSKNHKTKYLSCESVEESRGPTLTTIVTLLEVQ